MFFSGKNQKHVENIEREVVPMAVWPGLGNVMKTKISGVISA